MFLLTHRPEARPPQGTRAAHSVIRLGPLSLEDTHALVSELCRRRWRATPLGQLSDLVANRAGGNPLFVEEIVRSLIGKGVLVREGDRWATPASCEAVDVPSTLHGLLLSRIDRLPAERRRLLQEAAVLGAAFDEALLREVATRRARGRRARPPRRGRAAPAGRSRARGPALPVHPRAGARGGLSEPPARAPHRAARAGGAGAGARRRGAPRAPERPRGARAPLEPQRRTSPGARATCWPRATGPAGSTRTTTPSATTSAPSAPWPTATACDEPGAGRARAAGGSAGAHRAPGRGARALRGRARGHRDGRPIARGPRGCTGRSAGCTGKRATASGPAPASPPASSGSATDGDPIERAHLFQEMGRLAFRAGDNAAAIAWAERALADAAGEAEAGADPARVREAAAVRAHAYNTLGVALARTGRPAEAVEQIERSVALAEARDLLQEACRGYTNLSVLYSSLDPRAEHRDLPPRARDGEEGGRPRLPVAPLREPRGGLLRAHRPLRGGGHRGRQRGHRAGPPAGAARPPGGAADRAGPDPPVPRRSRAGLRLLRGGPGAGRAGRGAPAPLPLLRWAGHAPPRRRRPGPGRGLISPRRRRCASARGSSPTR